MGILKFIKQKPKALEKEVVKLFDKDIPLRIIKGKIIDFKIKTCTRPYDKDGNILRYGDGVDDRIVREEEYKELELYIKPIHFDGYNGQGHHESKTTLYFEQETLFDKFNVGDTITYFGLYLNIRKVWTNFFLYNHNNSYIKPVYFIDTINKKLFNEKYNKTELKNELDTGIERIKNNNSA